MTFKIEDVLGIGPVFAQKLSVANIFTTQDLLTQCSTVTGRKNVAQMTGVSESQIFKWTNLADLMRISGIGPQYAQLLETTGIQSLKDLRNCDPTNLSSKMFEINHFKRVCSATPPETTVGDWIDCAQNMTPLISF